MNDILPSTVSEEKNKVEGGVLYLVATPIGNLSDISERALKVLSEVDFIAAEDTRNSMRLLSHFGIKKPMISYFEHNKRERGEQLISRLLSGESCALITDAGTPAISDPGADLVVLCTERGIPVTSIPGACAAIVALTLSALPTGKFVFDGFLSADRSERNERLSYLASEERTMIFHEAPHKLRATLDDMCRAFGEGRRISLCRELTKRNEEVLHLTLGSAITYYSEREPRGEYVLVVEGGERSQLADASFDWSGLDIREHVAEYVRQGLSQKDAIKQCAKDRGVHKSIIYKEICT